MPIRAEERDASYPLIVAGGHATYNPEPMAPFIDVFVIGEAEDAIHENHLNDDGGQRDGSRNATPLLGDDRRVCMFLAFTM